MMLTFSNNAFESSRCSIYQTKEVPCRLFYANENTSSRVQEPSESENGPIPSNNEKGSAYSFPQAINQFDTVPNNCAYFWILLALAYQTADIKWIIFVVDWSKSAFRRPWILCLLCGWIDCRPGESAPYWLEPSSICGYASRLVLQSSQNRVERTQVSLLTSGSKQ